MVGVLQEEGGVPTRTMGFNCRERFKLDGDGFQLDRRVPTKRRDSNKKMGFQLKEE